MILIADSGSTKTAWRAVKENGEVLAFKSNGINPLFMEDEAIERSLADEVNQELIAAWIKDISDCTVKKVWFYGAGIVNDEQKERMCRCISKVFPMCSCQCDSDMLGTARALCGHEAGIACIMGTGANSCLYDGESITGNVRAGGFILGDEGSGAYLGKRLISDYIKGLVPKELADELALRYDMEYASIVKQVYREPFPQRYLAGFSGFIAEHRDNPYIQELLQSSFGEFINRNILQYERPELPLNFTGSVAYFYRDILEKVVSASGLVMGKVIQDPADALVEYHLES